MKKIINYLSVLFFVSVPVLCYSKTTSIINKESDNIYSVRNIQILGANFCASKNMSTHSDSVLYNFSIDTRVVIPYNQCAVKQAIESAQYGTDLNIPYFNVRFALPIPPAYTQNDIAEITGLDALVFTHNHSPGFEIMPNGDALAVYFSTPTGKTENDSSTSFVQARLRYGSEDWDMPELFFKTIGQNDQSALLWNDNGTIRFFGGGRGISDMVPFRMATSVDNGANWVFSVPQLKKPAVSYTAQPISNAFRRDKNEIYFAMDGEESQSFLWKSSDNGVSWEDTGGRTGGRHSAIIPLNDKGELLSIGGKNADIDGWSPQNFSSDWGANWSRSEKSPFPPLGTAQRPALIRLASGKLLFVSDSYMHKKMIAPPEGWKYGNNCFVALSADNGKTWLIKTLPVQLPAHHRIDFPSLGYVSARQASNGVIHILTTVTLPCLHYELNEAWIMSDKGDITPETTGGIVRKFSEKYANGKLKSTWSARICTNGRYLLHGEQTDYYENGTVQHKVKYKNGRKTGLETFWMPNGKKAWNWQRNLKTNRGIWIHYWPNGKKKIASTWNLRPRARDLNRYFYGYVAEGTTLHWDENGKLIATYHLVNGDIE